MPEQRGSTPQVATCPRCKGKGTRTYGIAGSAEKVDLGDGTYMQDAGGFGTRACECVRDLPAIDGTATWWESESIFDRVLPIAIGNECAEIEADCEIPRDDGGRRLHRTADNAYFPPLIKVMGLGHTTLFAEEARELALILIAAAEACDQADALAMATRIRGHGGDA